MPVSKNIVLFINIHGMTTVYKVVGLSLVSTYILIMDVFFKSCRKSDFLKKKIVT